MTAERPRYPIGSITSAPLEEDLRLMGRVLSCSGSRRLLRLMDESGSAAVALQAGEIPQAGDIVELIARRVGDAVHGDGLRVLVPFRGAAPFPSPGDEFYRLHCGERPRIQLLRERARCLQTIRAFFDGRGYMEVQTPLRVPCPGLEPHLRAEPAGASYLITSPEYHMKRLLAAGLERIYFLGPSWRGDELGHQHLNEFCILEWYQAYCSIEQLMQETEALVRAVAELVGESENTSYQGHPLDLAAPFARVTVTQAFREFAGMEIQGVTEPTELRQRANRAGWGPFPPEDGFDAIASRILVDHVEPALAQLTQPVFLYDFPAPLAALSQLKATDSTVAERFELYAGGLELANAFGELIDPDVQLRRLEEDQQIRQMTGAAVYPIDQKFINALKQGIPPSAGIALGVDRLLMLLLDVAHIQDVVAFAPQEV